MGDIEIRYVYAEPTHEAAAPTVDFPLPEEVERVVSGPRYDVSNLPKEVVIPAAVEGDVEEKEYEEKNPKN